MLSASGSLKIAVIGCGAAAELNHLPALALCDRVDVVMLVDTALARARMLADRFGVPATSDDYRNVPGKADAAIVALPNSLHAAATIDLLQHNVHVLVEKPMALSGADCDDMMQAADRAGAVLAVGFVLRFSPGSRFIKTVIDNQMLGTIETFDIRRGLELTWPVRSDYLLRKEAAGGGVLIDFGSHILDLLLWWFGDHETVDYFDDAMGGVEANCELHLRLRNGVSGVVELTWMRRLRNTCIIRGARGTLEVGVWEPNPPVRLQVRDQEIALTGAVAGGPATPGTFRDVFRLQLDDFVDAVRSRREPFVSGREGRRSVQLIESCYASRRLLELPWMIPPAPTPLASGGG